MASLGSTDLNTCPECSTEETQPLLNDAGVTTRLCDDNQRCALQNKLQKARSRYVTTEIPVVLASLASSILRPLEAEYIRERIADEFDFTLANQSSRSLCDANFSSNSTQTTIEDEIQSETARWLVYMGLAYGLPNLLMVLLIGAFSDRIGRKPILVLATLGLCLQAAVYLAIVQFQLPLPIFLAGDSIAGLSGGIAIVLATGAAYIADITPEKSRTVRIIALEVAYFLGLAVGQISLGFTLQLAHGTSLTRYTTPLWIALGCTVTAIVYATIPGVLIETVDGKNRTDRVELCSLLRAILNIILINTNGRRFKVIVYAIVMLCALVIIGAQTQLLVIYSLAEPFCLSALMASLLLVVIVVADVMGMIVGGAIFPRCMSNNCILQLCLCNLGILYLCIGFSKTTLELFISVGIGVFTALVFPVLRSQLSKIAESHEHGLMLAFIGCMDGIGVLASPVILNNIYSATVFFYPPFVFFFLAGAVVLPCSLIGILQCRQRKKTDNPQDCDNSTINIK